MFCLDRDIYYSDTLLFGSQSVVDNIINDISCMLKIPRRSLHIVSGLLWMFLSLFPKHIDWTESWNRKKSYQLEICS